MFHEITDRELKRRCKMRLAVVCCVIALIVAAWAVAAAMQQNAREQGAIALRESIMNAAKQCCAIEGSYPTTLEHLEQQYGIVVNRTDYVVSYESFAGNVMPTVVVTPK